MTTKKCLECGADFIPLRSDSRFCETCGQLSFRRKRWQQTPAAKAKAAAYRIIRKDIRSEEGRNWREANPKKVAEKTWRAAGIRNFTYDDFEALYEKQEGLCALCDRPFPLGGRKGLRPDDCHSTGFVRGLLCQGCNMGIGLLGDTAAHVEVALQYLERAEAISPLHRQ